MGVKDSYTDFHVDFGGTSVWYHILKVCVCMLYKVWGCVVPHTQGMWVCGVIYQDTLTGPKGGRITGSRSVVMNTANGFMVMASS